MSSIIAKKLVKNYGPKEVVRGIGLTVREGEVVGLLGPNGAGKTTTFYMLVGVVKPTFGDVYFNKQLITRLPLHERARLRLSYLPQESPFSRNFPCVRILKLLLSILGFPAKPSPKGRMNCLISWASSVWQIRRPCISPVVNAVVLKLQGP